MVTSLVTVLVLAAAPAAAPDTYRQDIQRLCDAQQLSGIQPSDVAKLAAWAKPRTPEGRDLVQGLAAEASPGPRATALSTEARRTHLSSCLLAEAWTALAQPILNKADRQPASARLPSELRSVILQHQGEVRACYEGPLSTHPTLGGDVTLGLALDGQGRVAAARVERSDLQSPQVEGCMVSAARQWRFGRKARATRVQVPFTFKPPEAATASVP